MILIRSLTFTFLWCFEKTRSSGMNEALLFNYSFSISRSSKSLITDLARWSVDLRLNNSATFILGKPQITPTPTTATLYPILAKKTLTEKIRFLVFCGFPYRWSCFSDVELGVGSGRGGGEREFFINLVRVEVLSGNMVKTSMCRSFIRTLVKTSTCRSFIRYWVKTST